MRAKLAGLVLAAAVLAPAWPAAADESSPTVISNIRQESGARSTRIVVECNGPLAYTYYSPDPLTLVVDIPEVDASRVPARINVGTHEVESLRLTTMARADGRSLARLEVRLASLVPFQVFSKDQSLTLVFERSTEAAAGGEAEEPAAPEPPPVRPAVVEAPPRPAAASGTAVAEAEEAPAARATRILSVSQAEEDGHLAVTVTADGALRYQDFFVGNPDRLVVDFPDVVSKVAVKAIEVNQDPVRKVRLGQFSTGTPKVARLVLDLSARSPYHILDARDGVKIVFGEGQTPSPAPLASLRGNDEPLEPAPVAAAPVAVPVPLPALPPAAPRAVTPVHPAVDAPAAPAAEEGADARKYTGHPISLDFKDGDLQDIFRLFADISGLNVVVNPGVSGKVTLKLTEVPWDQALDLILKANGLGYTLEGNVIRIAKMGDLQREEGEKRKLEEERALAGELTDFTRTISYAKAAELSEVLKKAGALSARGQVTLDTRTNTMIIRDLPAYVEKARAIIDELDRPTPQVEIEARIVITTRNFLRDLGIQWGFVNQMTQQYGNTTGLSFPNSIVINGSGVPSTLGLSASNPGTEAAGIGTGTRGYMVNMPASNLNTALGVSMGNILGNFNVDAALTAAERSGRGRIISTPKVTTQNNLVAEIKQGIQIPIQTVANNTVTVQFKDAVLTLRVTPQITEAGTVILQLDVKNDTPDFANRVNGIPPINTQSATTTVLVRDGNTAVIGGIYSSREETTQDATPFLSKVPILGYLFRNRFVNSTNNELLLFITPRIIKG